MSRPPLMLIAVPEPSATIISIRVFGSQCPKTQLGPGSALLYMLSASAFVTCGGVTGTKGPVLRTHQLKGGFVHGTGAPAEVVEQPCAISALVIGKTLFQGSL